MDRWMNLKKMSVVEHGDNNFCCCDKLENAAADE